MPLPKKEPSRMNRSGISDLLRKERGAIPLTAGIYLFSKVMELSQTPTVYVETGAMVALALILIGIFDMFGFIPCLARYFNHKEGRTSPARLFCIRCWGFWAGVGIATVYVLWNGPLDLGEWNVFGILCWLPIAIHGAIRRVKRRYKHDTLSHLFTFGTGVLFVLGAVLLSNIF